LVRHVEVVFHPLPSSPSRESGLLLETVNPSSAKGIGVIGDPELVAIGHDHSHVRLPPIAPCSWLRARPYAGRPRRWVRRHLLDQSADTTGNEAILLDPPPANRAVLHDARRTRQPWRMEDVTGPITALGIAINEPRDPPG